MARNQIDWERVEGEYRAGIRTLRDIAEEFGCTHGAIRKRAERDGWVRDLSAKIEARAADLVSKAEVSKEVSKESKAAESVIVEANAQVQANAILVQRRDVTRARGIVNKLFIEVEAECDGRADFSRLGEMLRDPDAFGQDKLNDLYMAVIDMPQRVKSTKLLADALKVLIELERKVLRIKDDDGAGEAARKLGDGIAMGAADAYARMLNGG